MKKVLYILSVVFLLNACDVDLENPNSITKKNYWKTETDAQY